MKKIILASMLIFASNIYAQDIKSITVTGNGSISIPANIATPNIAIEITSPTSKEASQKASAISNKVVSFLKSQKVNKLKTNNITIHPQYDYENNKQKLIGYRANNSISFSIDSDKSGKILDEIVNLGATRIDGISFSATDEETNLAKNQAIAKASLDAKQKAKASLDALGLSAKEIITIKVDGAESPRPMPMAMMRSYAKDESTPIIGGETNIDANVTLQISY